MTRRLARFELRLKRSDKVLLELAAAIQGKDLASFALGVLLREASDIVARYRIRTVTERGMRTLLKLIENPPAPNAALRRAARAHGSRILV